MALPNANISELTQLVGLQGTDKLAVWDQSTGITKHILASDLVGTASQDFEWVTTATYNLDDVVTYNGKWWQSLIGANTGNLPQEGAIWTEVSASNNFAFWSAGIYSQNEVIVLITYYETVRLARLKNATRPFISADFDVEFKNDDWEFVSEDELRAVNETAHGWDVNDALKIAAGGYEISTGEDTVAVVVKVVDVDNVIISLVGDVLHGFSALTPADRMYVQPDGSLDTPVTDFIAGIAISATEVLNTTFVVGGGDWTADATFTGASGTEIQNTATSDIKGQTGTAEFTGLDWVINTDDGVTSRSASGDVYFLRFAESINAVETDKFTIDINGKLTLPLGSSAGLWFGDGDTAIYENGDDLLNYQLGGVLKWFMSANEMGGNSSGSGRMKTAGVQHTFASDGGSGMQRNSAQDIGLYTGSVEAINIDSSQITTTLTQLKTTSDATLPAINVGGFAGDPSTLVNGDFWYNSTSNKFRAYENGSAVDVIGGGGDVTKVGTPVNDQIGVWTGDGTIEGTTDFTFVSGILKVNAGVSPRLRLSAAGSTIASFEYRSATVIGIETEAGFGFNIFVNGSGTASLAISTASLFTLINGANFSLGSTTGTKWGTATGQKQAWWNATPVVQPAHIADASGGATVDAEARTAINALLAQHATLGLQAAS